MKNERERKIEAKVKVERLLSNQDFVDIIFTKIMKEDLHQLLMMEGSSDGAMKAVDACKFISDRIYGIISEGTHAEESKR